MGIKLKPVRLANSNVPWKGLRLLTHQAAALESKSARLLVQAPTGGGKTWTAAIPIIDRLDRGEGAIFAYPTNALAEDQQESLVSLLRLAGRPAAIVKPDGTCLGDDNAEVLLWRIDSNSLDEAQEVTRTRRRGDAMSRLFQRIPGRPLWIITNPDTLFLLSIARYWNSPQIWGRLEACTTLVMDEFHLYTGPTLVRALLLIELAQHMYGISQVRLLSATLPDSLRTFLRERCGFETIDARETEDEADRVIQHPVTLEVVSTTGAEAANAYTAQFVCDRLSGLRAEVSQGGLPLVVLRQSVLAALSLEDELVRRGLHGSEIGVYRGLTSRRIRSMEKKTLVIGTSSLEVGVDFKTRRLIFEAISSSSFIQRIGRVGRHEPGEAHFVTDHRVASVLAQMCTDLSRAELFDIARRMMEGDDYLHSFPASRWAGVVAFTAIAALAAEISRLGGNVEFDNRLRKIEDIMGRILGTTLEQSRQAVGSSKVWKRLEGAVGFRGGTGSVEVFDVRERERRGSSELAIYEIDLPTFYSRAKLVPGNQHRVKPVVLGYTKKRSLHLDTSLRTAQITPSLNAPDAARIEMRVDGQIHPYESLLRDRLPIIGFFPKRLKARLSWRENVFESSDGRIALLNDDALKGMFLWEQA